MCFHHQSLIQWIQIHLMLHFMDKNTCPWIPKWVTFSVTIPLTTVFLSHLLAAKYKGICPKYLRPTQGPDKWHHVYFLESGLRDGVKGKISPVLNQVYWKWSNEAITPCTKSCFSASVRYNHLVCSNDTSVVSSLNAICLFYLYSWIQYCIGQKLPIWARQDDLDLSLVMGS